MVNQDNYGQLLIAFLILSLLILILHLVALRKASFSELVNFVNRKSGKTNIISNIVLSVISTLIFAIVIVIICIDNPLTFVPISIFLVFTIFLINNHSSSSAKKINQSRFENIWKKGLVITIYSLLPTAIIMESCMVVLDIYYPPRVYSGSCKVERSVSKNHRTYYLHLENSDTVLISRSTFNLLLNEKKIPDRVRVNCLGEVEVKYLRFTQMPLMIKRV
jgi:hypothetical protein